MLFWGRSRESMHNHLILFYLIEIYSTLAPCRNYIQYQMVKPEAAAIGPQNAI